MREVQAARFRRSEASIALSASLASCVCAALIFFGVTRGVSQYLGVCPRAPLSFVVYVECLSGPKSLEERDGGLLHVTSN